MGFRNSWVATEGPLARLLRAGGWQMTGEETDFLETGLYALELPGWSLVIGSGWDAMPRVRASHASAAGNALFLTQDDSSMGAMLLGYVVGKKCWSIVYDGSEGVGTPVFEGEVPPEAAAIWEKCRADQHKAGGLDAGVDYHYELVPELARVLTGFRHDRDPGGVLLTLE